jgi:hypothetical protein
MAYPQNLYPNWENFQEVSFPQEVTPPDFEPDEDIKCIRYNPAWSTVVMAAIDQLLQFSAWSGTDDEKMLAVNRASNLKIMLQEFSECDDMACCNPPMTGLDVNGNYGEFNSDGDLVLMPQNDPRNLVTQILPAVTGGVTPEENRCKAANSIVAFLQQAKTQTSLSLSGGAHLTDVAAIIEGILLLLGFVTAGLLAILATAVAVVVANVTSEDFDADFPDGIWDTIACEFYCQIDDSGSISQDGWVKIKHDLAGYMGPVGGLWLINLINAMGVGGCNNAMRLGSAGAIDCTACNCADCADKFDVYSGIGTDVTRGFDATLGRWIEVTAILDFDNFGGWAVAVTTNSADICCGLGETPVVGDIEIDGGAWGWQECGNAIPVLGVDPFDHSGVVKPNPEQQLNTVFRNGLWTEGSMPFRVRFYFV